MVVQNQRLLDVCHINCPLPLRKQLTNFLQWTLGSYCYVSFLCYEQSRPSIPIILRNVCCVFFLFDPSKIVSSTSCHNALFSWLSQRSWSLLNKMIVSLFRRSFPQWLVHATKRAREKAASGFAYRRLSDNSYTRSCLGLSPFTSAASKKSRLVHISSERIASSCGRTSVAVFSCVAFDTFKKDPRSEIFFRFGQKCLMHHMSSTV